MKAELYFLVLLLVLTTFAYAAPVPQNDIDGYFGGMGGTGGGGGGSGVDYNTVMGHFKDFFLYLPVMMTTLKETMTGFPKFAEGIRILASKNGRLDDDCKCKGGNSNEIENSSHYGF